LEPELREIMLSVIRDGIKRQVFPGAVASAIIGNEAVIVQEGYAQLYPESEKRLMSENTPFDLASLTKVVVTTTILMKSIEQGLIDLMDSVNDYINFDKRVRILNLANHSSGLPAWLPLQSFKNCSEAAGFISGIKGIEPGIKEIYSDLGFILLGHILEEVLGKTIDSLADEQIFKPLSMTNSRYSPCEGAASTEIIDNEVITGIVHDENARALGGKCGHAGLFSTAGDLTKFVLSLMRGEILSRAAVGSMTNKNYVVKGGNHSIGWQVITDNRPASAGSLLSDSAFGHTGFTGTSIWIDPKYGLAIVFLTNSVHYGRGRDVNKYRRLLSDAVVSFAQRHGL